MKKYAAVIICCFCFLLCAAMGIYSFLISQELDSIKNNSTPNILSDKYKSDPEIEKTITMLEETNQQLSKKITELTNSDSKSICEYVKSFLQLYFNRDYLSTDYNYYSQLYAEAEKYCTGAALDYFCPDIVVVEPETSQELVHHYTDVVSDILVYSSIQDDGSVIILSTFKVASSTTSNSDAQLVINPKQENVRLLNAKLVFDHDLNTWKFDTVYQLSTISGIDTSSLK